MYQQKIFKIQPTDEYIRYCFTEAIETARAKFPTGYRALGENIVADESPHCRQFNNFREACLQKVCDGFYHGVFFVEYERSIYNRLGNDSGSFTIVMNLMSYFNNYLRVFAYYKVLYFRGNEFGRCGEMVAAAFCRLIELSFYSFGSLNVQIITDLRSPDENHCVIEYKGRGKHYICDPYNGEFYRLEEVPENSLIRAALKDKERYDITTLLSSQPPIDQSLPDYIQDFMDRMYKHILYAKTMDELMSTPAPVNLDSPRP